MKKGESGNDEVRYERKEYAGGMEVVKQNQTIPKQMNQQRQPLSRGVWSVKWSVDTGSTEG